MQPNRVGQYLTNAADVERQADMLPLAQPDSETQKEERSREFLLSMWNVFSTHLINRTSHSFGLKQHFNMIFLSRLHRACSLVGLGLVAKNICQKGSIFSITNRWHPALFSPARQELSTNEWSRSKSRSTKKEPKKDCYRLIEIVHLCTTSEHFTRDRRKDLPVKWIEWSLLISSYSLHPI